MPWPRSFSERVAAVSALDDPMRRALLDLVTRSEAPVSRDEAAQALGLSRRATAFHLDRLAENGLLDVEFRRLTGLSGPGAGHRSKPLPPAAGGVGGGRSLPPPLLPGSFPFAAAWGRAGHLPPPPGAPRLRSGGP